MIGRILLRITTTCIVESGDFSWTIMDYFDVTKNYDRNIYRTPYDPNTRVDLV
jgi:hypothetical protein